VGKTGLDALIIGSGVIGLTTGVLLQESGRTVRIIARESYPDTTSANSGAIWGPFLSEIDKRVLDWSFRTFDELVKLSSVVDSAVQMVSGVCVADFLTDTPEWVQSLNQDHSCDLTQFPAKYICGWGYAVPILDMPAYLDYLARRFLFAGGSIEYAAVDSLDEFSTTAQHVVNCSGLGARRLAHDESLVPSKGQLIVLENPGLSCFFAERGEGPQLLYILPQREKVVLGGTAEVSFRDSEVDPVVGQAIIDRCATVEPRLLRARVLGHRVGLRPCRPTVRLDHQISETGTHIIHNYGHGGSGVSLSWACAEEVLALVAKCETKNRRARPDARIRLS
jgi:D-amino-acid oxidase